MNAVKLFAGEARPQGILSVGKEQHLVPDSDAHRRCHGLGQGHLEDGEDEVESRRAFLLGLRAHDRQLDLYVFGRGGKASLDDFEQARRELDDYFEGRRHSFDLRVDLTPVGGFHRDVLARLARVPYGSVTTYGALAAQAGRPRAARAVGTAMNRNPVPIVLPCHRVVGANGGLVGYGGGIDRKVTLLRLEGVEL